MSLLNIFNIAGSGMNAQSLRLNITASNLANAESVSGDPANSYRARQPVFSAMLDQMQGDGRQGGVRVDGVVESQAPLRKQHAPDNPLADKDGFIHLSNVNTIEEMANMISASRSFQNNVEVFNTAKQLVMKTLTLGQ